ncbi:MAG: glycosyl hydrolase family 98 [Prevotella sp.]|nr:glycosyl hydrolase family 98 [Prevotella sp.]
MKQFITKLICTVALLCTVLTANAQERRPIDSQHPLWFIHVDVWYKADPQKIIDLIPDEVKPYVCLNLSLSCQYDTNLNLYKMPQNAFQTYKSWGTVCQQNGMWFTCQPASGGHTHIQDNDLVTFEYFFKKFPNFLGWNYAEQFWGFDEAGDKSSSTQTSRWALFAKLVEMSHQYGGFLTVSFCGNIWSHPLNPIGELKRNKNLMTACQKYPEAILYLYKYTTSSCFYNNESVTFGPFISGLTKNYGVRYDNCGWNGALSSILGEGNGKKYPAAAGIGTVMEQTCVNGGAVWDGPELTWNEECFHEVGQSDVSGYKRRNWERFKNFNGVWLDMFTKMIDGTMYIPSREEVVGKTKIVVINDVSSGTDEDKYATWGDLYNGIYKQTDPFNRGNGQWMENFCYFKSTGRYGAIPMVTGLYDDLAKAIPVQIKKSQRSSKWGSQTKKQKDFNDQYPVVSKGDLYVNRYRNQLVTYTPYTYLNKKTTASAAIPLQYNTCDTLELEYGKLSAGVIREYADHIDFYLNNYRSDSTAQRTDVITIKGATEKPEYKFTKRKMGNVTATGGVVETFEDGIYRLAIKHNGAIDVTINCAGNADRSDVAEPAIEMRPLDQPKQPELYRGPVIIEAEDMDFKNIKSCVTDPYGWYRSTIGHAGNGFADMGTNTSGALRHQLKLKAGQEGEYTIAIRYTCTSKAGNITVTVNGQKQTVKCEKTATNEWLLATVNGTMKEGNNTLTILNTGGLPMYIDQVIYQPNDIEPMKYFVNVQSVKNGSVTANVEEAAEGDLITLTVTPDEGYRLSQLRVVNSVFYTLEKTIAVNGNNEVTFTMPHDNVTLQPVFADASAAYKLDFTSVDNGTLPPGWRCTQENNDVHEYPNNYGQGSRTMAGFTGHQGKGIYWREQSAEYGQQSAYPLKLQSGDYKLTFAMAAWKGSPKYKAEIIEKSTGSVLATSDTYTATPNANGNTGANLTSAQNHELPFTVTKAGNYIIRFTNESKSSSFDEFLLLECSVKSVATTGGIRLTNAEGQSTVIYDLSGTRQQSLQRGINIIRTADGKTRKVVKN